MQGLEGLLCFCVCVGVCIFVCVRNNMYVVFVCVKKSGKRKRETEQYRKRKGEIVKKQKIERKIKEMLVFECGMWECLCMRTRAHVCVFVCVCVCVCQSALHCMCLKSELGHQI